jgi:hypothetical protein
VYVGGLKSAGVLAMRAATRSETRPCARWWLAAVVASSAVVAWRRGGGEGEPAPRVPSIHLSLQPTRSRKASGFLRAYGRRAR